MAPDYEQLRHETDRILAREGAREDIADAVVALLEEHVPHYDWVGLYMVDPDKPTELHLMVFRGTPTVHTRIPIDTGICGAAVREGATIVIPDVKADDRYLACSAAVQSEIVVPIFKDGTIIGEIDIDSHTPDAFTTEDREFLEQLSTRLAGLF